MLEPATNQPDEQIVQLQVELAQLKQENVELRASLEACQAEQRAASPILQGSPSAENLQLIEADREPAQGVENHINGSTLESRLLEATATAATALLTIAPLNAAVNSALQLLGEALETDRMTVIENFDNPPNLSSVWWRLLYEWTSPYAMPQITHPDLAQGSYKGIEEWYARLSQGQGISCLLEEMPEQFRSGQAALGVKALHAVPVFVERKYWGVIVFDDCREAKRRSPAELAVLRIAADCVGSVIQQQRTQQAMHRAEQERAAELAKANEAMQATIDAMARVGNLDEFVPAVLQIVGQTFGTENCSFYEHYADEPIYLRYWRMGNRVLRPADLLALDGDRFAMVHQLANGFTVPDDYLGTPVRERTKPVILDHTIGTSVPEFHEFACKNGWDVELNVPLVVDGFADGALLIYRPAGATFTPSEIALAEALGQQLALAMQGSRLAAEGKAKAVEAALAKLNEVLAREQEQAAQERAAELEKVNEALRQHGYEVQRSYRILKATAQATDALLTIDDFDQAVNTALQILGESLETDRTKVLESLFDDPTRPFSRYHNVLYEWTSPGTVQQRSHPQGRQVDTSGRMEGFFEMFLQTNGFGGLLEEWDESLHAAFQLLEVKSLYVVPIWVDRQWWGILAFDDCREAKRRTQAEMAVLQTVANCIGSAIQRQRIERVHEEAERQVLLEREQAAQERAAELAKANEALRQTVDVLTAEADLDRFLGRVLRVIAEQLNAPLTEYWFHPEPGTIAYVGLSYWQGQILMPEQQPGHPGVIGFPVLPDLIGQESLHHRRGHFVVEDLTSDLRYLKLKAEYGIDAGAWYEGYGVTRHLNVPLILGDNTIGALAVFLPSERHFTEQQIELAYALAQQVTLAIQLTRLAEEAKQAALLEERNRMAREIHDTLAQSFTSIRMQLEAAIRLLNCKPEQAQACITFAQELAKSGLAEARRSVWALQPEAEDYRHLSATLQRLAMQQTAETSIQVEVVIVGTPYALPPDVGMNLLRIGQEALNNAIRHASAQTILTLTYAPNQIQLQIQDNGQGFDPQQLSSGGFGLIGMQQRSDRLGGTFTIRSQPGHGTEVKVTVPILGMETEKTSIN